MKKGKVISIMLTWSTKQPSTSRMSIMTASTTAGPNLASCTAVTRPLVAPENVRIWENVVAPTMMKRMTPEMGISLLIAESHVTNATRVADRFYAIDRGEIIFAGHPRELLQNQEVLKTIRG